MNYSPQIQTVLDILQDEVSGKLSNAKQKTHEEYKMTWVYKTRKGELFPTATMDSGKDDAEEVYAIKGRMYEIYTIAEVSNTVFVEMVESYPDNTTGSVFRTPLVLVLEFKDLKIVNGKHYCDPSISYEHLSEEQVRKLYRDKSPIIVIK